MRADLVGINNLITQGNSKNCMNPHTNQGHYSVGGWTQFCKMSKLNAESISSQVVTSVRFKAVPIEQQTSPKGIKKKFIWHCVRDL